MLAEFVNRIAVLARESAQVDVVDARDPRTLLLRHGGQLVERDVPPALVQMRVDALPSLVKICAQNDAGEVYVHPHQVVVLFDSKDRREQCSMLLVPTKRWTLVQQLERQAMVLTPAEAVRFLRFEMPGSGAAMEALVQALRRVDFARTSTGAARVEHGRETLGRSVEATVQGVETIPETVEIAVPVWSVRGLDDLVARVTLGIHLDVEQQRVVLRVLADETERAMRQAVSAAAARIADAVEIPVYEGIPQEADE